MLGTSLFFILQFLSSTTAKVSLLADPFQLLSGITNCDVQVIHNGAKHYNLQHLEMLLPVSMVNTASTPNLCKNLPCRGFDKFYATLLQDIVNLRTVLCRISLILLFPEWLDLGLAAAYYLNLVLSTFHFFSSDKFPPDYQAIRTTSNIFPVLFSEQFESSLFKNGFDR